MNYGIMTHWCWIRRDGKLFSNEYVGIAEQIICYYIPVLCSIVYIAWVSIKVQLRLNSITRDTLSLSLQFPEIADQAKSSLNTLKRLRLYPLALLLIFTFPLVDRLHYAITNHTFFILSLMHSISNGFLGTLHCLIYFSSLKVRQKVQTLWTRQRLPSEVLYEDQFDYTRSSLTRKNGKLSPERNTEECDPLMNSSNSG
jgi:hypothetical protein